MVAILVLSLGGGGLWGAAQAQDAQPSNELALDSPVVGLALRGLHERFRLMDFGTVRDVSGAAGHDELYVLTTTHLVQFDAALQPRWWMPHGAYDSMATAELTGDAVLDAVLVAGPAAAPDKLWQSGGRPPSTILTVDGASGAVVRWGMTIEEAFLDWELIDVTADGVPELVGVEASGYLAARSLDGLLVYRAAALDAVFPASDADLCPAGGASRRLVRATDLDADGVPDPVLVASRRIQDANESVPLVAAFSGATGERLWVSSSLRSVSESGAANRVLEPVMPFPVDDPAIRYLMIRSLADATGDGVPDPLLVAFQRSECDAEEVPRLLLIDGATGLSLDGDVRAAGTDPRPVYPAGMADIDADGRAELVGVRMGLVLGEVAPAVVEIHEWSTSEGGWSIEAVHELPASLAYQPKLEGGPVDLDYDGIDDVVEVVIGACDASSCFKMDVEEGVLRDGTGVWTRFLLGFEDAQHSLVPSGTRLFGVGSDEVHVSWEPGRLRQMTTLGALVAETTFLARGWEDLPWLTAGAAAWSSDAGVRWVDSRFGRSIQHHPWDSGAMTPHFVEWGARGLVVQTALVAEGQGWFDVIVRDHRTWELLGTLHDVPPLASCALADRRTGELGCSWALAGPLGRPLLVYVEGNREGVDTEGVLVPEVPDFGIEERVVVRLQAWDVVSGGHLWQAALEWPFEDEFADGNSGVRVFRGILFVHPWSTEELRLSLVQDSRMHRHHISLEDGRSVRDPEQMERVDYIRGWANTYLVAMHSEEVATGLELRNRATDEPIWRQEGVFHHAASFPLAAAGRFLHCTSWLEDPVRRCSIRAAADGREIDSFQVDTSAPSVGGSFDGLAGHWTDDQRVDALVSERDRVTRSVSLRVVDPHGGVPVARVDGLTHGSPHDTDGDGTSELIGRDTGGAVVVLSRGKGPQFGQEALWRATFAEEGWFMHPDLPRPTRQESAAGPHHLISLLAVLAVSAFMWRVERRTER